MKKLLLTIAFIHLLMFSFSGCANNSPKDETSDINQFQPHTVTLGSQTTDLPPDPVTVKILETIPDTVPVVDGSISYEFENLLSALDAETEDREYHQKVEEIQNDTTLRTVEVSLEDLQVLQSFSMFLATAYDAPMMPPFENTYNLDTQARQENMLVMQAWAYYNGLTHQNMQTVRGEDVKICDVTPLDSGVREITFRLRQNLFEGRGQDGHLSGNWFIAHIISTENGSEIIHLWLDDPSYIKVRELTKDAVADGYSKEAVEQLEAAILNEFEQTISLPDW